MIAWRAGLWRREMDQPTIFLISICSASGVQRHAAVMARSTSTTAAATQSRLRFVFIEAVRARTLKGGRKAPVLKGIFHPRPSFCLTEARGQQRSLRNLPYLN